MKEKGSCWISAKARTADEMDPREMSELLENGCRISHQRENLKLECGVSPGTCRAMPHKEMGGEIKDKKKKKREENLIPSRYNHG